MSRQPLSVNESSNFYMNVCAVLQTAASFWFATSQGVEIRISNCLKSQEHGPKTGEDTHLQDSPDLIIALRIVSSLRMQATSATFFSFPAAQRR